MGTKSNALELTPPEPGQKRGQKRREREQAARPVGPHEDNKDVQKPKKQYVQFRGPYYVTTNSDAARGSGWGEVGTYAAEPAEGWMRHLGLLIGPGRYLVQCLGADTMAKSATFEPVQRRIYVPAHAVSRFETYGAPPTMTTQDARMNPAQPLYALPQQQQQAVVTPSTTSEVMMMRMMDSMREEHAKSMRALRRKMRELEEDDEPEGARDNPVDITALVEAQVSKHLGDNKSNLDMNKVIESVTKVVLGIVARPAQTPPPDPANDQLKKWSKALPFMEKAGWDPNFIIQSVEQQLAEAAAKGAASDAAAATQP